MKKMVMILGVLMIVLIGGIVVATRVLPGGNSKNVTPTPADQFMDLTNTVENTEVEVAVTTSSAKENTVIVTASKLASKYSGVAYEVTYETNGTFQGVNSGTKPIDVTGKETFERDVYLGTCSRNVCKPHTGVTSVSVVLQFTDTDGNKSQVSKDFPLE